MANHAEPGTAGGASESPGFVGAPPDADVTGYAVPGAGAPGTVPQAGEPFVGQAAGSLVGARPTFHGRPVSWFAVSTIMVAFVIGGFALMFGHGGPTWWLFWLSVAVAGVGGLLALATGIFDDWY